LKNNLDDRGRRAFAEAVSLAERVVAESVDENMREPAIQITKQCTEISRAI
jgi:hypothetical protein